MKNNVIRIMDNNKAQVSKTFAKNAKIYGTSEYRLWREFKAENPEYEMVVKSIKTNPNKETNKNLTYDNMRLYIKEQEKSEELIQEFEKVVRMSKIQANPYRAVLAWFKQKFENYDSYKQFFKELEKKKKEETKNTTTTVNDNVDIESIKECA